MAVLEISIIPIGTGSTSVSSYVADCHRYLASVPGISYELGAMGTLIQGEVDTLFTLARELHELSFHKGAQRVYTVIKLDDRRDKHSGIKSKVESVQDKLKA